MTLDELINKKNELSKRATELAALKKRLYGKMDIESPMSEDEKRLNSEVAAAFSAVNQVIMSIRELHQSAIDAADR